MNTVKDDNIVISTEMRTVTLDEIEAEEQAERADIARRSAAGARLVAKIKNSSKYFGQSSVADRLAGRPRTDAEFFPVVVGGDGPGDYVLEGGPGGVTASRTWTCSLSWSMASASRSSKSKRAGLTRCAES